VFRCRLPARESGFPALTDRGGGAIVVAEMANGDEGDANWTRVCTMFDLLRAWARTMAAAQPEK
jgi:hypothetical protein